MKQRLAKVGALWGLIALTVLIERVLLALKHTVLLWLDWHLEGIAYTFGSLHKGPCTK